MVDAASPKKSSPADKIGVWRHASPSDEVLIVLYIYIYMESSIVSTLLLNCTGLLCGDIAESSFLAVRHWLSCSGQGSETIQGRIAWQQESLHHNEGRPPPTSETSLASLGLLLGSHR